MSNKTISLYIILAVFMAFAGCNSATYEIIEVEEPVPYKEEVKTSSTDIKENTESTENKEEKSVVEDIKTPEHKYTEKQVVSRTYVIQIGAYLHESSAEKLTRRASNKIADPDISYKYVDGLYKVRLSKEFNDKSEAIEYLKTIWALRFHDSFVVEITKVKSQ